ncbi:sulfite exporter TauE/SafE family protein [Bacillus songklensis]|uniref:Probable membrane transporter protein n=1 Tax=Bacillus songklensis TaxID=1069116 RepID=A0ABV8B8W4_9BACI
MTLSFLLTVFSLGFISSFLSGMLGIGGSIVLYPLLLFVPPVLGFSGFEAHDVTGIGAIQALVSSITGVLAYRQAGFLHKPLILYMGISVLLGGIIGSSISSIFSEWTINVMYALLATTATVMMFLPKKGTENVSLDKLKFSTFTAVNLAFLLGIGAGIVGAGGAFLLVPIMLVILKIPTRVTIASSLAITFLSSIGTTMGKVATGQVLWAPALLIVLASILASPLGATIGKKTNTKSLQMILASLIMATSIKIWFDIFH